MSNRRDDSDTDEYSGEEWTEPSGDDDGHSSVELDEEGEEWVWAEHTSDSVSELWTAETDEELVEEVSPPAETTVREDVSSEVLDDVHDYFEELEAGQQEVQTESKIPWRRSQNDETVPIPSEEFIEERWFDFDYLDRFDEVERQWVNYPFSYVSVVFDDETSIYRYQVVEPRLDQVERYILEDLTRVIRNSLMYEDLEEETDRREVFKSRMRRIVRDHAATVDDGTVQKLFYYFVRNFLDYGKIDPLMRDPEIEDISCDGARVPVFVYHRRLRDVRTNVQFEHTELNSMTIQLAQRSGKHISVSNPLVDASLPDGSRIQLTLGSDISGRGSNFTIRKFSDVPFTPIDLIEWNTFSLEQMAYLWLAIENNKSLIFAGGTGSGKTTSLNAIALFIPPDSKVITIEDTREVTLPHDNWIQSITRPSLTTNGVGEVTTYDLLQSALRQRPEYLLVGEIRTEQRVALTFFQAIGTGHTALSTFHADSVEGFLSRIQNAPLSIPTQMVNHLDIVSIQSQVFEGTDRVRRNKAIAEISLEDDSEDEVDPNVLFERNPATDSHDRVGDSVILEEIAAQRGWDDDRLASELDARRTVLEYLLENDINDYRVVGGTIHAFARNPERVLSLIQADDLEPRELDVVGR